MNMAEQRKANRTWSCIDKFRDIQLLVLLGGQEGPRLEGLRYLDTEELGVKQVQLNDYRRALLLQLGRYS